MIVESYRYYTIYTLSLCYFEYYLSFISVFMKGLKEHVDKMNSQSESKIAPAFILGTRRGDPNVGDQETFAPSSDWMPVSFMRVNPILNWYVVFSAAPDFMSINETSL